MLVQPTKFVEKDKKVVFMAGPIQGAADRQSKMYDLIHTLNPNTIVASPRPKVWDKTTFDKSLQIQWETYHLNLAAEKGVILFWLANEEKHIPERAYAQTTHFELGEYLGKGRKVIIGFDANFSNTTYLKTRLKEDYPEIYFTDSMEELAKKAVQILNN